MKTIRTLLFTVLLASAVLVGCGNNNTPAPPAIPTASGLPAGEPTLPANVPVEGYPAPEQILVPTIDPASYPAPLIPTIDPATYPEPVAE